ncbi:MAG: flagellar hook-associated protein FlgK [Halothiobacillus sp. 14-56-357]|jgi:flagellar hook-associated protein 1 FlgK|uniref:flagellar hook-associated protein FlgK n=1 Tax=Halothiobacillus sp. 15-55-196 TaxID=1970382 RepID=UPI000BCF0799|nr:flagellar hook-associated protein FlgK [Halothiobacillus sp. 15-55-196]OZB37429.1 MAG: flagellar hook-associated protein FlgK [Halothiobacillus sp. 15-55-196]OZB56733.1 MAG: flagellar hook-associated protein FlgK [Halothiobacillus sp. 14-56-357]OZB77984.1 MAG: flagellar hook-associated protein FlgK [Halothiobacillus sp. 13-55-115]
MPDLMSNSVTGLLAMQQALATTGNNIANANTPGYSRERVNLASMQAQYQNGSYIGSGVQVASVTRVYDQFITSQLNAATTTNSSLTFQNDFTTQVTQLLGDTSSGISQQTQAFFNATQAIAANPTDATARSTFLGSAQALTDSFNRIDSQLQSLDNQIGQQASDIGRQINTYAKQVASLNGEISKAQATNPNALPNDLLDQRDQLITQISSLIDVKANPDNQGNINLTLASGESLVLNSTATNLSVGNLPSGLNITLGRTDITSRVNGGTLGGMLEAQSQLITPLRNQLGRAALVLADQVNQNQTAGVDLNGNTGTNLFTDVSAFAPQTTAQPTNKGTGSATGAYTDPTLLTGQTYLARYDGSNWQVSTVPGNGAAPLTVAPGGTLNLPGLDVTFAGAPQSGDVLNILPTVGAAGKIGVVQQSPSGIAAAAAGQPAYSRDNTQIQKLFDLSSATIVGQTASGAGNGSSLSESVSSAVSQAGAFAGQVQLAAKAASATLTNLTAQQQSVSGVNLDEEAANLLKYQQQYQALSQSISSANTVFQSLLSAFR